MSSNPGEQLKVSTRRLMLPLEIMKLNKKRIKSIQKARNLRDEGDLQKSIEEFESIITDMEGPSKRVIPLLAPIYDDLACVYKFVGEFDSAEKMYRKYLEMIPKVKGPDSKRSKISMEEFGNQGLAEIKILKDKQT